MLSHLDRKLWRDLRRMKGQAFAVAMGPVSVLTYDTFQQRTESMGEI